MTKYFLAALLFCGYAQAVERHAIEAAWNQATNPYWEMEDWDVLTVKIPDLTRQRVSARIAEHVRMVEGCRILSIKHKNGFAQVTVQLGETVRSPGFNGCMVEISKGSSARASKVYVQFGYILPEFH